MGDIVNLISNVGFPIAMCVVIMYYWNNQYTKTIDELKTTISQLTTVVTKNTEAITSLEQKMGVQVDDNK